MSAPAAAPALALALVPPEPPEPARRHALPTRSVVPDPARMAKVRRVLTAACVAGALFPVVCVAAAWYLGPSAEAGMVVGWLLLLPGSGLALVLTTALERSRECARALVLVAVSMALAVALVRPAARAGTEAFVSSHAAELDVLAARRAAELSRIPPGELAAEQARFYASSVHGPLRRLGLNNPQAVQGGIVFSTDAPFSPSLLYADQAMSHARSRCDRPNVKAIGGRWYLYDCH